jgi:hypothetical protein
MIRDERGVSLAELLLVLAFIVLIGGVLVTAMYQIVDITGRGNNEMVVQHDLRNAAVWLNRDVLSASKAVITQEGDDYQMTLEVPRPVPDTVGMTTTIDYVIYTYSEETGDLIRRYSGLHDSSATIARNIAANPFPPPGTTIKAPQVVTIILGSLEGNVRGSGTFALEMRAGGYIEATRLCQVTGESLEFVDSDVRWLITNDGQTSPSIDEIYITWPITNAGLTLINLDTSTIWDGLKDPTSATISSWQQGSIREIVSGTHTLEFTFESNAFADEAQYSIAITLTDRCTFSFPPNP